MEMQRFNKIINPLKPLVIAGYLLLMLFFVGCSFSSEKSNNMVLSDSTAVTNHSFTTLLLDSLYTIGLPLTARIEDESDNFIIFLYDEKTDYDEDAYTTSLYVYEKQTKLLSKILATTEPTQYSWVMPTGDKSVKCEISDIHAIYEARLLPNARKVLVSGIFDMRNSLSYIINLDDKGVLLLPTNGGLVGFTMEEGYVIMQSYKYNESVDENGVPLGGRHTLLSVFDDNGRNINSLDLEQ